MMFDEASSALDSVSESLVYNTLARILSAGQRTAVFIAQRLSTLNNCDRILSSTRVALPRTEISMNCDSHRKILPRVALQSAAFVSASVGFALDSKRQNSIRSFPNFGSLVNVPAIG
jgi:ABC-type nitrate/sulfonate/bicarbonate transport system ATPase subunit